MLEGSQIEIVPCGPSDLAELRVIGLQSFTEAFAAQNKPSDFEAYVSGAFDPAVLERELLVGASEFYFSKIDGRTAGYLKVNHPPAQDDDFGQNCLEIQRIYTLSIYYGQGVGEALLKKAIEIARYYSYNFVWLGVWEHNPRAIRFYQKNGFEVFGQHSFLFGSDLQTDDLMRKLLPKMDSQ